LSPKLPAVTAREVARVADRLGFVLHRQKGSHAVYLRKEDKARVVIPVHAGKNIKPKTLSGIIEDMGLTAEQFRRLLQE
jgi:predicted RNA binding protein YcfA (HicA-like mRNA interferase family)